MRSPTFPPVRMTLYTEYTIPLSSDVKETSGDELDWWVESVGVASSKSSESLSEPDILDSSPDES